MATEKNHLINNDIYDHYGERWYVARNDPVALLRAQARARNSWIISEISGKFPNKYVSILDIGCGAGFLSNELALHGFTVTGLDASAPTLEVARRHDAAGTVDYRCGNAYKIEFADKTFDVVCAMDFLEHVEYPGRIVSEVSRLLSAGGMFFFYTFNRNFLAWLIVIKGVEWFIRNTPRNMHCLRYFIKPGELKDMCRKSGLEVAVLNGMKPKVFHPSFWKLLAKGIVDDNFTFEFTRYPVMAYIGYAIRIG
jgi:2-polyprenyl-6-hydroxyphenyl methylase / 3-demethylubiquinone-9 3-methyltransferase